MGKILRGLQKLGLVENEDGDFAASVDNDTPVPDTASPPEPVAEFVAPPLDAATDIVDNRPFDDIYAACNIPGSPYPAEKLLKMLDGLRAMDLNMRRTAVLALDAADDNWAIEDAVLDAQRKIKALEATKLQLNQTVENADADARAAIAASEQAQTDSATRIRQQIADLEALLTREVEKSAKEKADLEAGVRATRSACIREQARIDAQIHVLGELPNTFAPAAAAPTTSNQ